MVSGAKESEMKIEITRYDWQLVNGQPKIVIHQVKLMEDDGTYIKFGKLKDVIDLLPYHPVKFRAFDSRSAENVVDYDTLPF